MITTVPLYMIDHFNVGKEVIMLQNYASHHFSCVISSYQAMPWFAHILMCMSMRGLKGIKL